MALLRFAGIGERITKELTDLAPSKVDIEVVATPEREFAAWIGCSIFSPTEQVPAEEISKGE
jgi:actin